MKLEFRTNMRALYEQAMAKKRKKMALYEVFSKDLTKSHGGKQLEQFKPHAPGTVSDDSTDLPRSSSRAAHLRPRMMQLNRGRVEISMPYQVAIVVALMLILCVLAAYRLGQRQIVNEPDGPVEGLNNPAPAITNNNPAGNADENLEAVEPVKTQEEIEIPLASSPKTNWIVIKQWKNKEDLFPVKQWYAGNGIETQIREINGSYYLHTVQKYDNPSVSGTDGARAMQQIIRIGAGYVAPPGSAKFNLQKPYGKKAIN